MSSSSVRGLRIAILGGSFNPITNAHLSIAALVAHSGLVDEVWLLPCGARPDKPSMTVSPVHRLVMTQIAVNTAFTASFPVTVNDYETCLPRAKGTWSLMEELSRLHPQHTFYFVVGADLVHDIPKWDDVEYLPDPSMAGPALYKKHRFLVVERPGYSFQNDKLPSNFSIIRAPFAGCTMPSTLLSSSEVRLRLGQAQDSPEIEGKEFFVEGLVPPAVLAYILRNRLYRQSRGCDITPR